MNTEGLNREPGAAVPIQVVFQGGGAKLCLMMAVCEVLKSYETKNHIKVTRVAGSSAGAIAAAMLASERPVAHYRSRLELIGPKFLGRMVVGRILGITRVFLGMSYFPNPDLETFFRDLFCNDGDPRYINELRREPQLYFTDLYSLRARASTLDEAIPRALAKSCRFPFAFSGYSSANAEVDGGLALNLPVDSLIADQNKYGPVIGVGFSSEFGEQDRNLFSYAQQLFTAAIENGVGRSEALIGPNNVFRIDTKIGTFDFAKALSEGFDTHYKLVLGQFQAWLDSWLASFGPIRTPGSSGLATATKIHRLIRPPLSNAPLAPAVVRELNGLFKSTPSTHAKSVTSYDVAILDPEGQFTGKYRSKNIMKFIATRPTNVLQFYFQTGTGATYLETNFCCAAINNKGSSLPFIPHVQELPVKDPAVVSFVAYLFFEQPLVPNDSLEPYIVDFQYEANDSYKNLGKQPYFSVVARRGYADEMLMATAFPRTTSLDHELTSHDIFDSRPDELERMEYENQDGCVLVQSEELPLSEFVDKMNLDHPTERYFVFGRRAKNTKPGDTFGFVVK